MPDWQSIDIGGKPADLFEPSSTPRHVLLFLHPFGGETLAHPVAAAYTQLLQQHGIACVCPIGGQCWWADRIDPAFDPQITAEHFLLDRVLPWMRNRWPNHREVGLFGISMGGQGALRLAFKHSEVFPVVAAISSAIEYYQLYGQGLSLDAMYSSKEQCRQDTVPMHIHPSRQPRHVFFCCDPDDASWFRGSDRLHEKMLALGAAHESDLTTRAGGHSWQYFNAQAGQVMSFLLKSLLEKSRRLI
ncbi:MAG: alpha/beta hydrolase [Gemmataceae bacterium]